MARGKYNVAATTSKQISVCLELTRAISRARTLDEIYPAALDAVADGLGVSRACIRLIDPDGVMRFKAFRGISEAYRGVAVRLCRVDRRLAGPGTDHRGRRHGQAVARIRFFRRWRTKASRR